MGQGGGWCLSQAPWQTAAWGLALTPLGQQGAAPTLTGFCALTGPVAGMGGPTQLPSTGPSTHPQLWQYLLTALAFALATGTLLV